MNDIGVTTVQFSEGKSENHQESEAVPIQRQICTKFHTKTFFSKKKSGNKQHFIS